MEGCQAYAIRLLSMDQMVENGIPRGNVIQPPQIIQYGTGSETACNHVVNSIEYRQV